MRKLTFIIVFFTTVVNFAEAQKFGYVNTEFVLSKMPGYKEAQEEINQLSLSWQEEIQNNYSEIEAMYGALQAEEVLLTKDMRNTRLSEIQLKEQEVKEYQKQIFGFEGLFFLKKKELIKPVQDEVFDAVEKVAKNHRLQIVFDKSSDLVMIYTDPIHDYTDFVLEELGLVEENEVIK